MLKKISFEQIYKYLEINFHYLVKDFVTLISAKIFFLLNFKNCKKEIILITFIINSFYKCSIINRLSNSLTQF